MSASVVCRAATAASLFIFAGTTLAQVGGTPVAVSGLAANHALSTGSANGTAGAAFSGSSFGSATRVSVINQSGDVVMVGAYGGGVGVWRNSANSNTNVNVARGPSALPAPATSGTYNATLAWGSPFVDSSGNAAFYNAIAGTTGPLGSTTDAGFFRASTTGAVNFATRGTNVGTSANNIGGGTLLPTDYSGTPVMQAQLNTNQSMMLVNNNGASLLVGTWRTSGGSSSGNGVWTGAANAANYDTFTPVYLRNDQFSGLGYSGILGDFVGGTSSFNDSGRFACSMDFQSGTGTPSRTSNQNRGVVTNRNGAFELLMIRSTGAPWLSGGETIGGIGSISPSMNNAGQIGVAFPLTVGDGGVTQANDNALARFNADGSVSLLQEGSNSGRQTGGGANIRLGGQLTSSSNITGALISGNGTLFAASIGNVDDLGNVMPVGGGHAALFRWSPESGTRVIALSGDTAPSTGGGQFNTFGANRAVNNNDQIAFFTNLVTTAGNPGGVTTANDLCLFATDVAGNLILIAREGFALPGDPVGGRTVSSIFFGAGVNNAQTNGQDGRGMFFNDAGQLVFNIGFSDGNSGVFVANVAPVPGAAAVLGLGAMIGLRRRRS